MRLNFGGVLAWANGEGIRTDLRERYRSGILRGRGNRRDANAQHCQTGKQGDSKVATTGNSIHQDLSFNTQNEILRASSLNGRTFAGGEPSTAEAAAPLNISRNPNRCQCEGICNLSRYPKPRGRFGIEHSSRLALGTTHEGDRYIVGV